MADLTDRAESGHMGRVVSARCGKRIVWMVGAFLIVGCQDYDSSKSIRADLVSDTAWAVSYLTGTLLNEYIAGRPAGEHDVTVPCSRGGSIRMTGNTAYDNATAILTMDVTYAFDGAHATVSSSNLVVTFHPLAGSIRQTGAMRLGAGPPYEDHTVVSTGLVFDVTIERDTASGTELSGDGPYELVTRILTNGVGQTFRRISGELDNVGFSWDYDISTTNVVTNVTTIAVLL